MTIEIVERAFREGRKILSEKESKELLFTLCGIQIPPGKVVSSQDEAVAVAEKLGYPVVAKGLVPGESHKSDKGLVMVNVSDSEGVKRAFRILQERAGSGAAVLIEKMIVSKREFLLGLHTDSTFGPVVVFGLGGVLTEVLDEVSMRLCPVDEKEALKMLDETRASRLLGAFRGEPPVSREKLASLIASFSRLPEKAPEISSVDVNPLMPMDGELYAADALVVLK